MCVRDSKKGRLGGPLCCGHVPVPCDGVISRRHERHVRSLKIGMTHEGNWSRGGLNLGCWDDPKSGAHPPHGWGLIRTVELLKMKSRHRRVPL